MKVKISNVLFGFSVAVLLLCVTAFLAYAEYGRGIGYGILIIFLLVYITIGNLGALIPFWWLGIVAVDAFMAVTMWRDFIGGLGVVLLIFSVISVTVGLNASFMRRRLYRRIRARRSNGAK